MSMNFSLTPAPTPRPDAEREQILANPGFGTHFTDHMAVARWTQGSGWHDDAISALAPFQLHPAAPVLHYGQEIFEGLKAYRHADDSIWLFRPEMNARRFNLSAQRLAMPELPEEAFLAACEGVVKADAAWVPSPTGEQSLYLRPFMFADGNFLGVKPSGEYIFSVIACPSGSFFPNGPTGVNLWVTTTFTRAAKGGTGEAKCGGNYAASLLAQVEAAEHGCEQVMYLDGETHTHLEESGTMNVFLVTKDGELITPGLEGTILHGVTRDSVLALAPEHDLTPVQRDVSLQEVRDGLESGYITEVFAAGTAVVITPIVGFRGDGYEHVIGDGTPGDTTMKLREHLTGIQYGTRTDTHGWMRQVVPATVSA